MKFSVIFPVYNTARYLKRALDSLCAQTMQDFEVIAVNDGSTDESESILREYAGKLDLKIVNQANQGLSGARNSGMKVASGDFVYMMDSDDYIHPELLRRAEGGLSSGLDFVVFDCRFVHDDDPAAPVAPEENAPEEEPLPEDSVGWFLRHRRGPMVWQYAFRREAIESRRFIPGIVFEDYPFTLLVHADRTLKGAYLPSALYYYVQRDCSIMHSIDWRRWLASFEKALTFLRDGLSADNYEGVVRAYYIRMFRTCWRQATGNERKDVSRILERMRTSGLYCSSWLPVGFRIRLAFGRTGV